MLSLVRIWFTKISEWKSFFFIDSNLILPSRQLYYIKKNSGRSDGDALLEHFRQAVLVDSSERYICVDACGGSIFQLFLGDGIILRMELYLYIYIIYTIKISIHMFVYIYILDANVRSRETPGNHHDGPFSINYH